MDSYKTYQELLEIISIAELLDIPGDGIPSLIAYYRSTFVYTSQLPKPRSTPISNLQGNFHSQSGHIHINQTDPQKPIHIDTNSTNPNDVANKTDQQLESLTLFHSQDGLKNQINRFFRRFNQLKSDAIQPSMP